MSNPTSNFNWQMPTNTDLVSQLPADFEVFGQAVDTSLADLKGGTTGQILSKNSNTDMDFVWASAAPGDITGVTAGTGISGGGTSGDVTITNSMATAIDAKGDLIAGTGADAFSRLAIGTNGNVLTADSAEATGMKWAAGGGMTLISTTTLSGASTTIGGFGTSYKSIVLVISKVTGSTASTISLTWGSTNGEYFAGLENATGYTASNTELTAQGRLCNSNLNAWYVQIDNYTSTTLHMPITIYGRFGSTAGTIGVIQGGAAENATSAVSQVTFNRGSGNFTGGTVYTYGVN